jgi:hypothetical protein
MHAVYEDPGVKSLLLTLEDPVEEMMFEESVYAGVVGDWLQNMRPW